MEKNMVKTIEVKLDTKGFAFESGEISKELVYLEQLMKSFSKELSQYLGSTTDAVQLLITTIDKLAGSMEAVASWDVSGVSSELEKISKTLDDILKKLKETNWSEIISIGLGVYDSFGPNSNTFGKLGSGGYVGKFESGKSKKGGTQSGEGGLMGIASGGLDLMDGSISTALDDFVAKMKNSAAATWLQNAATTAWQGISTAATAVTTAFGAAMNFLTSPIGLVVIGIAALIAIVVLLIANWDTVKAAVLSAWEAIVNAFGAAAEWFSINVVQPVVQFFTQLWKNITDFAVNAWAAIQQTFLAVGTWFNETVIQPVAQFFSGLWTSITGFAASAWTAIQNTFLAVGAWFNTNVVQPVAGFFAGMWDGFKQAAVGAWEGVKSVFSAVAGFFGDIFSEAWAGVVKVFSAAGDIFNDIKEGILSVFKTIVNGLIDGINAVVSIPFEGINAALRFVKGIEIAGLKPFGGLKTISVPQIPHLAQGAVLPANKPFLAVVGDQRHGTNVEAPLGVIQEAVRAEVGDMISAILTGFNQLLQENRALRRTVESIELGDATIGRAARRYEQRMAVMGGTL